MLFRTIILFAVFVALGLALLRENGKPAYAAPNAAALYVDKCGICHEANGQGTPVSFPPLAQNPHVTASDPSAVILEILNGMPLTDITVRGHHYGGGMPAWGNWLSNSEVAAIATYIRTSWGNHASAVTEEQVAKLRKQS